MNKKDTIDLVKKVLAKDCAVNKEAFDLEDNIVVPIKHIEGRRLFPIRKCHAHFVSFGKNSVIAANNEHVEWIAKEVCNLERDDIYSPDTISKLVKYFKRFGAVLISPELKYLCDESSFKPYKSGNDYKIEICSNPESLYKYKGFGNALTYNTSSIRKDKIAVTAKLNDEIIAIACATEDSYEMYQIGIDVKENYRFNGIGKTLVSRLAELIFDMGKVPYYSTTSSNLGSRNLAVSLGFYPVWIEMYTR